MDKLERPSKSEMSTVVTAVRTGDRLLGDINQKIKALDNEVKTLRKEILEVQRKDRFNGIPIDDINSANEGIKVASLKAAGLNTIADVMDKSIAELSGIEGIGETQASKIKTKCNEIRNVASEAITLNLGDEKSEQLIEILFRIRHINLNGINNSVKESFGQYHSTVSSNIQNAESLYGIKWFFTKSQVKDDKLSAYYKIKEVYDSKYFDTAGEINKLYQEKIESLTREEAVNDFKTNTAPFYALLERICGKGALKQEAEIFKLPKELISQIDALQPDLSLMNATLRTYQEFGTKYIINQQRVLLGDEMGLGKTMQAIAAMAHFKTKGMNRFLVVCPVSVLVNWGREIQTHSKMETMEIYGNDRDEEYERWLSEGGIAVTTYETLNRIDLDLLKNDSEASGTDSSGNKIDMLVVDEAHYVKNPQAKRTMALKKVAESTDNCLFMTGTPLENKVDEMIFLLGLLRPTLANELSRMKELSKADEFKEKIAPVYLRRVREDVLTELPEKVESEEWVTLGENELKTYKNSLIAKNMSDMRRVSYNVENSEDSSKINRIIELCEDAKENGRKVIIFSFFLDTIQRVSTALGDKCFGTITGAISSDERQGLIDDFGKSETANVLVSQITAGGVGLNIQCASVVILCEPQWKPSIENQAISRCYRMGQANSVLVYRILASKTVDEKITKILKEKSEIFEKFADESEIDNINKSMINDIIEEERKAYGITEEGAVPSDSQDAEVDTSAIDSVESVGEGKTGLIAQALDQASSVMQVAEELGESAVNEVIGEASEALKETLDKIIPSADENEPTS